MQPLVAVILVGVPLAWLVAFAAYVYLDAPNHEMDRRKWALICFFVPLFGFFAYVFERGERDYDPSEDPYAPESDARKAGLAVHERRRGEKGLGPAGTEADDADETNEWNDPDGIDIDDDRDENRAG
ncbi:hypothetical protein FK85_27490 [Halorubrum saccharovorum]|uniref:Uncharacterized protein n=1 Tax=Halorubrum saccharovorum TaxID=2248 RepID=A0A0F8D5I6_9EURY|nr:PLD nuclease N-terminal domain-containing protein [Halorubrum saccharovorum]KKF39574.1 hypothetical protein FK85_27490 [Halorubrum saccharovorum]